MTPNEIRLIGEMLNEKLGPILRRLDALEQTDRKHSGVHRDLAGNIRQSRADVLERADDTVSALARRDEHLVAALKEVRDQIAESNKASLVVVEQNGVTSTIPAAPAAAAAAIAARNELAGNTLDTVAAKSAALAAKISAHRTLIAAIVSALISTALGAWQAWHASGSPH